MEGPQSPSPALNGFQQNLSQSGSQSSPSRPALSPAPGSTGSQNGQQGRHPLQTVSSPSGVLNVGANNPLTMYLNQMSAQQAQEQENRLNDPMALGSLQSQSQNPPPPQPLYNGTSTAELTNGSIEAPLHQHKPSSNGFLNVSNGPTGPSHHATASTSSLNVPRAQHSRAVSLPSFSQEPFGPVSSQPGHTRSGIAHQPQSSFSSFTSALGGLNHTGFGLAIQNESSLPGWAEEEIGAK